MDYLLTFFVFSLMLFLYLHIYYHLKTGDDLEVYTLNTPSKDKLEDMCTSRQPVLFKYNNKLILDNFKTQKMTNEHGVFDVGIRKKDDDLYLPVLLREAIDLFRNDKEENYFTEKNYDLLQETGLHKILRNNDYYLRPPMVSN